MSLTFSVVTLLVGAGAGYVAQSHNVHALPTAAWIVGSGLVALALMSGGTLAVAWHRTLVAQRAAAADEVERLRRVLNPQFAPLDHLIGLRCEVPALTEAIDNAIGERMHQETRGQILDWCLRIERALQWADHDLWQEFRKGNLSPGLADRDLAAEGTVVPEGHWDKVDSSALRRILAYRADALGRAIMQLKERQSGGEGEGSLLNESASEDREVGVESDVRGPADPERED